MVLVVRRAWQSLQILLILLRLLLWSDWRELLDVVREVFSSSMAPVTGQLPRCTSRTSLRLPPFPLTSNDTYLHRQRVDDGGEECSSEWSGSCII